MDCLLFRFSDRGRDFCMECTIWNPIPQIGNDVSPIHLRMENEHWGVGNFTGLFEPNSERVYIIQF